jgi:putative transposase
MSDHVHTLISIPPKHSVAQIIGFIRGKSSIWIAQNVSRRMRNCFQHEFWAFGYMRNQELADQHWIGWS